MDAGNAAAALENLPASDRLRTSLLVQNADQDRSSSTGVVYKAVDVGKLDQADRDNFIRRNFRVADDDNGKFLERLRNRFDRVRVELPKVEVRFMRLSVEAECYVGRRALPTLINTARNMLESALASIGITLANTTNHTILRDISGLVKPSRMTLLLGPPSSGKTTLLLALAGLLDQSLKVSGEITYNGYNFSEFVPQKTSAYVSQNNVHLGELTVKETLDYSARFQGIGSRRELLVELLKKEEATGGFEDADVDLFLKACATEGSEPSIITEYILKILGLDVCKDTLVGNEMVRGISGGQKKRVTSGEMIVGPAKVVLMDEVSTGLDSSTTLQIVRCMQQIAHSTDCTILMSLLQPDPETFDLFDDVMLLSDGQIVYQGPRLDVLPFFRSCGFRCPDRKGTADFLQEVTSRNDQEQYWEDPARQYRYVSATEFATRFKASHVGLKLEDELKIPYDKRRSHRSALVRKKSGIPKLQLLKTSFDKEWLLLKRTSFVYAFKAFQLILVAFVVSTVFLKTTLDVSYEDGPLYVGAIIFSIILNMFNGFAELSITISRLPVFYKHRDLLFYPAWAFTLPSCLLRIPIWVMESAIWTLIVYNVVGYAPDTSRFFKQLLIIFLIQNLASSVFRLIAGVCRSMIVAHTGGALVLFIVFLLSGFILPIDEIPKWWNWAHWISPLSYGFKAMTINEMLSPRWMNKLGPDNSTLLGLAVLDSVGVDSGSSWYWIGAASLMGFIILFNILFTFSLMFLNPLGKPQAIIPEEDVEENKHNRGDLIAISRRHSSTSTKELASPQLSKKGMVLPFVPLSMSFDNVNYYVDMPKEMKSQGVTEQRLQLLREVSGAFRPGVLTALMGVSGAGKTTLMDVLAGRKTGGYIEGDIRISGFPKKQDTFARISSYCEQNDIHSPQVTVIESLIYSACLRLPKDVPDQEKMVFVNEVMELVELSNIKHALVGLPGVTGLSTEQRKRLTIAVELVANPSIIFMDEPTSGLDARAAAIVMRTVRNTVDTGRTVVCTIHQPSIDIFESFDELLLMKTGGQLIYSGPLGLKSHKIVEYFEAIPGVPKIREKYNPAAWMLEVSSASAEAQHGINFADYFEESTQYQENSALVKELSKPACEAEDLHFPTQYSQSTWVQFKACLWKQWWTYWRSPDYNLVRYLFSFAAALVVGTVFWHVGTKREDATDLNTVIGAMYMSVIFVGVNNCMTIQPIVATERTVFYRERAAGMYHAFPYAIAQVVAELPYVFVQATYYTVIVYAMGCFQWTVAKFLWFLFISFFSFLYFTYFGMMTVSITANHELAAIVASAFASLFTLFSGFFIPRPRIPKWWVWCYWVNPVAWTVYGLIVSQYGNMEETIKVAGMETSPSIKRYLETHFGYNLDFMAPIALVLVGYALFFAFLFGVCIQKLNFQRR